MRVAASALSAISLASCASLPPNTPARQAKAPSAYETARTFDAPAADWPADGWWKRYGDAQLDALMDEALEGSPTLAQARARVIKARATRAVTAAAELPALDFNGSVEEQKQTYTYLFPPEFLPKGYQDYGELTLNLNWELDFWGKNRAAVAAATSEARASAADEAEARLVLTTDIASAYADLARLYADREVAVAATAVREQTAGLVSQRVSNGLDTQAELQQAQAATPASGGDAGGLRPAGRFTTGPDRPAPRCGRRPLARRGRHPPGGPGQGGLLSGRQHRRLHRPAVSAP
jgi:outer membrane protein TolC